MKKNESHFGPALHELESRRRGACPAKNEQILHPNYLLLYEKKPLVFTHKS